VPRNDEMIALDDLPGLIRKVEELGRQRERAKGRYEEIKARIVKQFGCKTLKEAKALLAKKHEARMEAYRKYTRAKAQFEKEWKERYPNILKGL